MSITALKDQDKTTAAHGAEVGLKPDEYARATELLGHVPSKLELGVISAMWSEHCSYKSTRIHLAAFDSSGERVLVGPGENAGVVDIGDGQAVAFKVESHNHPSYIEPFQGAATGVGGILRDVFTMGARPIAAANMLRFGAPDLPKTPHLLKGVVAGVGHYGNCFGVPTVSSDIDFDARYDGNVLVNAFALGLVDKDKVFLGAASGVGNPVLYMGAKTGRDGIHGATMASDSFSDDEEAERPTVQVGDPFKEKSLLEACHEAFATGHVIGIQDMGAAGLTSSAFEMASRAGVGVRLDLDRVPMREVGMTPYELMLSESQERMLAVVEKGQEASVIACFEKWGLSAVQIGEVTDSGLVELDWHGERAASLPAKALADEAPKYDRPRAPFAADPETPARIAAATARIEATPVGDLLDDVLGSPGIADRTWATAQFDHTILGATRLGPGQGAAAVVAVPAPSADGLLGPVSADSKGISVTLAADGRACEADPYEGARRLVLRGLVRHACVGADVIGLSDCLNDGSPERPGTMFGIKAGIDGMADAAKTHGVPVVSGNVSLYNETSDRAVLPSPSAALVGLVPSVRATAGLAARHGDALIYLGWHGDTLHGAEVLWRALAAQFEGAAGTPQGPVPAWSDARVDALVHSLTALVQARAVTAAVPVGRGGIATAAARMAIASERGVDLGVIAGGTAARTALFGEGAPGALIAVRPARLARIARYIDPLCPSYAAGTVGGKDLILRVDATTHLQRRVSDLSAAWSGVLPAIARGEWAPAAKVHAGTAGGAA